MVFYDLLYNGQTNTAAAGCRVARRIRAVKPVREKNGEKEPAKRAETEKCARQIRDCEAFLHVEPTLGALLKAGGAYEE